MLKMQNRGSIQLYFYERDMVNKVAIRENSLGQNSKTSARSRIFSAVQHRTSRLNLQHFIWYYWLELKFELTRWAPSGLN